MHCSTFSVKSCFPVHLCPMGCISLNTSFICFCSPTLCFFFFFFYTLLCFHYLETWQCPSLIYHLHISIICLVLLFFSGLVCVVCHQLFLYFLNPLHIPVLVPPVMHFKSPSPPPRPILLLSCRAPVTHSGVTRTVSDSRRTCYLVTRL